MDGGVEPLDKRSRPKRLEGEEGEDACKKDNNGIEEGELRQDPSP